MLFDKMIESVKSWVSGSGKNKQTEEPRITGEHVISGAVVRDSIFFCSRVGNSRTDSGERSRGKKYLT